MTSVYLDTSALAKWYMPEHFSDEVEAFISANRYVVISRLTVVEMRCLLARRYRAGFLSKAMQEQVFETFEADIQRGYLFVEPVYDRHFIDALTLIQRLPNIPLRTLDALHLAIALAAEVSLIATADKVMTKATQALGVQTQKFF